MRLNCITLIWLLLAGCAQSPARPDVTVIQALAAVRGEGPRVVRGLDSVREHLLDQKHLAETRAWRLRRWCEGADLADSSTAELYCPGPDGTIRLLATPLMPADWVLRSHEPSIDGGDWVVRVGDFLLIADQGGLTSIDVSGPEGEPFQIIDQMSEAPDAAGDLNSTARLLVQSGQLVLCSYSGSDRRTGLTGLGLDVGGRIQRRWRLEIQGSNVCTKSQDRAFLYPDALFVTFLADIRFLDQLQSRSDDGEWQPLHVDEVFISGQVAPNPILRVLLHCPLPEPDAGKLQCVHRTVLSDGQDVLYLGADSAFLLLAEAEDRLYLEPWMVHGYSAFPQDIRGDPESAGFEYPANSRQRQTWVIRVPLQNESPIQMVRLGGWQFHRFPAAEVDGDLFVLTRQQSPRGRQSLTLHRLGQSEFSGSEMRLRAPILDLSLRKQECFDQWLGEGWAWFAFAGGDCAASPSSGERAESARLLGVDLRTSREYRLPLPRPSWLLAPGGKLIAVSGASHEHLRLLLLQLGREPQLLNALNLPDLRPPETVSQWDFGPTFGAAEHGRLVLNLPVVRQNDSADAQSENEPIQDLLLLEVAGDHLRLLGVTDSYRGSGWHPSQVQSSLEDGRLLVASDRLLLVAPGALIELVVRDGGLTKGVHLSF